MRDRDPPERARIFVEEVQRKEGARGRRGEEHVEVLLSKNTHYKTQSNKCNDDTFHQTVTCARNRPVWMAYHTKLSSLHSAPDSAELLPLRNIQRLLAFVRLLPPVHDQNIYFQFVCRQ